MKIFNLKRESILWIFTLLPFCYILYIWPQLPMQIPVHYNLHGEADGWSGRTSIFMLPGISLLSYLLLLFLPQIDPKRMNTDFFRNNFYKIRILMTVAMAAISILLAHLALSTIPDTHEVKYIPVLVLLLLTLLGNFMINIKPNWFIGIRTPWTMSSDHVWKQTHLVFGRLWFYGGLICIGTILLLPDTLVPVIIATFVLGSTAFAFLYSYLLYRKEQSKVSGS